MLIMKLYHSSEWKSKFNISVVVFLKKCGYNEKITRMRVTFLKQPFGQNIEWQYVNVRQHCTIKILHVRFVVVIKEHSRSLSFSYNRPQNVISHQRLLCLLR